MSKPPPESTVTAEFLLSPVEAVVAGTLALMTAMAQGCCGDHRAMIRRKVIARPSRRTAGFPDETTHARGREGSNAPSTKR